MKKILMMMLLFGTLAFGNCDYYKQQMDYFYTLYVQSTNPYEKQRYYDIYISYSNKYYQECKK